MPSLLSKTRKVTSQEENFFCEKRKKSYEGILTCLLTGLCAYLLLFLLSFFDLYVSRSSKTSTVTAMKGIIFIYLALICGFYKFIRNFRYQIWLIRPIPVLMFISSIANIFESNNVRPDLISLEILFAFLTFSITSECPILALVCLITLMSFIWLFLVSVFSDIFEFLLHFFTFITIALLQTRSLYTQEKNERKNFNLKTYAQSEINENKTLLKKLMPKHALKNLQNELYFTDRLKNVTLLYADIVGFTNWSSNKAPNEIVMMLSELFTNFDRLCVEFDVYKVCTIGDCYVVMGLSSSGVRNEKNECLNIAKMGFKMIEVINQKNIDHQSQLNMRIGIHTGEVIGGIIGTSIVRYDIWGPDVLIANKMESNGSPGKVKVSKTTKDILKNSSAQLIQFEKSNHVEIKNLNISLKSYYISCEKYDELLLNE